MGLFIIEDEEKIAHLLKRTLEEESYGVEVCHDGREGLNRIMSSDFNLLVVDLMLPGMSGLDLIKEVRAKGRTMPILILTAKDAVSDKVTGLDQGADDYLTKPFAIEEFLARVRALLRKNRSLGAQTLKCGDLVLDWKTRKVTRGGKEIELSVKEFSLLEFLLTNQGAVVSRTMIGQQVWDMGFDTGTNYIDVHINRLRKKVDAPFGKPLIKTIRGAGYMIKE